MDNELSLLSSDDLQVQLEQRQKAEAEKRARELLKQETSYDYSYQEIIKRDGFGFMQVYLLITTDKKTMTTKAKRDVVLSLAKYDLLRDLAFCLLRLGNVSFKLQFVNLIVCLNLS